MHEVTTATFPGVLSVVAWHDASDGKKTGPTKAHFLPDTGAGVGSATGWGRSHVARQKRRTAFAENHQEGTDNGMVSQTVGEGNSMAVFAPAKRVLHVYYNMFMLHCLEMTYLHR